MAKTTGAFKLSKEAKRALAIIKDPEQRNAWKRCLSKLQLKFTFCCDNFSSTNIDYVWLFMAN